MNKNYPFYSFTGFDVPTSVLFTLEVGYLQIMGQNYPIPFSENVKKFKSLLENSTGDKKEKIGNTFKKMVEEKNCQNQPLFLQGSVCVIDPEKMKDTDYFRIRW